MTALSVTVAFVLGALVGSVLTVIAWQVPRGSVRTGRSADGAEQSGVGRICRCFGLALVAL